MSKYILELSSVQSNNLKILFEVIKEVLFSDINLIFTPNSILVGEMDGKEQCMIHLELDTSAFEYYYCESRIAVGINASNFYKIIKTAKNQDTISFYIEKEDESIFTVKLENSEKNKVFESYIKRLDIPEVKLGIPPIEYPSPIITPSSEFQKICRDMNSLGSDNIVEITSIGQQIIFRYNGDFSKQKIIIGKPNPETEVCLEIVQGKFDLKFLLLFTKATNLSNTVNIHIKNDAPLILDYSVGNLGKLSFILNYFN